MTEKATVHLQPLSIRHDPEMPSAFANIKNKHESGFISLGTLN